tara:strand:+ start:5273 stop:5608 length:336 start_codon:yes stop_codon:yes gene_type:complete
MSKDIMQSKFKKFLIDENLKTTDPTVLAILERAFYTGATEYYSEIQNTGQVAKKNNPENEAQVMALLNAKISSMRESITKYWKKEVEGGTFDLIAPSNKLITLEDLRNGKV